MMKTWRLLFSSLEVITPYNLKMNLYQSIEVKTFLNLTLPSVLSAVHVLMLIILLIIFGVLNF
jgi:hypothetical protein